MTHDMINSYNKIIKKQYVRLGFLTNMTTNVATPCNKQTGHNAGATTGLLQPKQSSQRNLPRIKNCRNNTSEMRRNGTCFIIETHRDGGAMHYTAARHQGH